MIHPTKGADSKNSALFCVETRLRQAPLSRSRLEPAQREPHVIAIAKENPHPCECGFLCVETRLRQAPLSRSRLEPVQRELHVIAIAKENPHSCECGFLCGKRDLNPYSVNYTPLKRARLPVPPLPHTSRSKLIFPSALLLYANAHCLSIGIFKKIKIIFSE